jgi:signal transduction histidine kinase
MKNKSHSKLHFYIEDSLKEMDIGKIIIYALSENGFSPEDRLDEKKLNIIFSNEYSGKKFSKIKNKLIILPKDSSDKPINCYEVDFRVFEEVSGLIRAIQTADWWSAINHKLKESEEVLNDIKENNPSADQENIQNLNHEIELISEIELMLLREDDIEKWNLLIKNFAKKNHLFTNMSLLKEKEILYDESIFDPYTLIFQLPIRSYFLVIRDKNILKPEEAFKIEFLVLIIMRSIQSIVIHDGKDIGEIEFWKKIFSKIPYPMAVISELGELLIYNEHFATIGILPRECFNYKDNDHLEISQLHYKIRKFDFDFHGNKIHFFIFYTSEKIMNNPNNELGIVSSSIAHELNNPLAGILAALSLLRLENEWSDDAVIEIEEMKDGAKRCKELVEIFLGFSRLSPKNSGVSSLRISLDQAINLLRFRMVESDLRIDMKLNIANENINMDINSSVLSMILYLILSELMTAFAHHRLLTTRSVSILEGRVLGLVHQLQFVLNEEFEYEKNILDSKLLQHLLFFEKLEIVFLKKEIRIIKIYK